MRKYSLIRKVYLYLFTIIGLTLLVVGSVRFINMALKAFIFTKADQDQWLNINRPPVPPYTAKQIEDIKNEENLTESEKISLEEWIKEYNTWKKESSKTDYLAVKRQKDASLNLSLIIVGLPLYLYHWFIIKREMKEEEEEKKENSGDKR